ncbi:hypothetical protein Btru_017853 [Bulinus truncatus]|nr:hypothetical protein Btru_017853 [Bulinus truncatus]
MLPGRGSQNGHTRPSKLAGDSDDEKLDLTMNLDKLKPLTKTPAFIYVLTFFSALGGFLFGYDTGVISGAMILLRNDFSLSSVWQELIVSVTIAAAAIFALIGGFLNDRLGRRPVIMGASILFTLGSIMMAVAKDKFALLAGRVVVGAGIVDCHDSVSLAVDCHDSVSLAVDCHDSVSLAKECHDSISLAVDCHDSVSLAKECHDSVSLAVDCHECVSF